MLNSTEEIATEIKRYKQFIGHNEKEILFIETSNKE